MTIESEFELANNNPKFLCRDGAASALGSAYSQRKLCFSCTDRELLARHLFELSKRPDCFFVKFGTSARGGIYLGRCFLTTDEAVGEVWARYKSHPSMYCNVQDDDFTTRFRDLSSAFHGVWRGDHETDPEIERSALQGHRDQ